MGINKFKQIWKNRSEIMAGIKNSVIHKDYIEVMAADRDKICSSCEHKGNKCTIPGTGPCCNICGCSLKLMQRSPSSECDIKKWTAVLSQQQEDQLNNQFNPQSKTEDNGNSIHGGGS